MFSTKMQLFLEHVLLRILGTFLPKNAIQTFFSSKSFEKIFSIYADVASCKKSDKIYALFFIKLKSPHFGPILECLWPKNFKKCFFPKNQYINFSLYHISIISNLYQSSVVFYIGTTHLIYTTILN